MSKFGSRSTQRSAISASSASLRAVVSLVVTIIAIETILLEFTTPTIPRQPFMTFRPNSERKSPTTVAILTLNSGPSL